MTDEDLKNLMDKFPEAPKETDTHAPHLIVTTTGQTVMAMLRKPGTCKDCKWWKSHEGFNRVPSMLICEVLSAQMQSDERLINQSAVKDEFILHQCHDGGDVQTGPDFGCIHWENK